MFLTNLQKSTLASLAGTGFPAIGVFMAFFMVGRPLEVWITAIAAIALCALMSLFYLLPDMKFGPSSITWGVANFIAGMLWFLSLVIIAVGFMWFTTPPTYELWDGFRIFILSLLSAFSVFLLLYSLFLEESTIEKEPAEDS